MSQYAFIILQWHHNEHDGISNHQPYDCLLNRLFRRRSKKTSKLRVTGLCAGNSPGTGEFPAQMASNAENVSIWWHHNEHDGISDHRHLDCLLSRLFRLRSKKTLKLHVTGLCDGDPLVTGGIPSQRTSNGEFFFHLMMSSLYCAEQSCHVGKQSYFLLLQPLNCLQTCISPV